MRTLHFISPPTLSQWLPSAWIRIMEKELVSEALTFSSHMAPLLDQVDFGTFILRQSSKSQHKYRLFCL